MGRFSKIKEAAAAKGGIYFEPGNYRVKIKEAAGGENKKNDETFFAAESSILESTNSMRPAGSLVNWYQGLSKKPALGQIKAFLIKALYYVEIGGIRACDRAVADGVDEGNTSAIEAWIEEQIDDDLVELVIAEQMIAGVILRCVAVEGKSEKGNRIVKVRWFRDDERTSNDEEVEGEAAAE